MQALLDLARLLQLSYLVLRHVEQHQTFAGTSGEILSPSKDFLEGAVLERFEIFQIIECQQVLLLASYQLGRVDAE